MPDSPRVFFVEFAINLFDAGAILFNAIGFGPFGVAHRPRFKDDALGGHVMGNDPSAKFAFEHLFQPLYIQVALTWGRY